jgi:rubredoxin
MSQQVTIKINYRGGIISPGEFYNVLVAAGRAGVRCVSFGLRQQLLISLPIEAVWILTDELKKLNVIFETDINEYPNIISSYPAEEVFIHNTWLSEGVYKDIFDEMNYRPKLKINISDSNQSFTPILTGNINWVASSAAQHFWHLLIRFPKTNVIYEWDQLVYTNDVSRLSRDLEKIIIGNSDEFYDNKLANGDLLFKKLDTEEYITQPAQKPVVLPSFNLPYYEGLNRYNDKYWLGIYRRDQLFDVEFLKELCLLCLKTKIGQICSTPWKSVIIKAIEEKNKAEWNRLLEKHNINMRHAANELNFQVEDDCKDGLDLKNYLVKGLNLDDIRTFGLCIGIKTRRKSEVFSSILVRRKSLISFLGIEMFHLYDILCSHDFNPNARTGFVFSRNNLKFVLREQLRSAIVAFYADRKNKNTIKEREIQLTDQKLKKKEIEYVHQCKDCLTVYDKLLGEPGNGVKAGTEFELLPENYRCYLCEASKDNFVKVEKRMLGNKSKPVLV